MFFVSVDLEATVSFEYNYTNTNTTTTSTSRSWNDEVQISVPPKSQVTYSFIVQDGPFVKDVVLQCNINGDAVIWFNGGGIIYPIAQMLAENGVPGVTGGYTGRFQGLGKLQGKMGLQSFVNVVETPLLGYAGQTREYQIPVTGKTGLGIPIFDRIVSLPQLK
ncbi:hypothetical protein FOA24_33100 [Bacillus thuringiensis]|uniref:ETX/MTX2 family pore-forming toxin n=1 Tax=Bacillus thuringiensis TaxID=1428 RepID=UPI003334DCD3